MHALRQRAAFVARRSRPFAPSLRSGTVGVRSYATDSKKDAHHHEAAAPPVKKDEVAAHENHEEGHGKSHEHHDEHHHDDDHHHEPGVEEKLGTSVYIFAGAVPTAYAIYSVSRPGEDGTPSMFTQWLRGFEHFKDDWEIRNNLRTQAMEQAAQDKHLFMHSGRNMHIELKAPEVHFHAGSPYAVPAGHSPNLDHVVAHYKKQHLEAEKKKAAATAAATAAAAAAA